MLNLAGPCQQFIGGQPLSNESMNINLDIDNLDFIHLDFHHLETLVHNLPNSLSVIFATFEKHFLMMIPQKKDQRVIHEPVFVTHDWQARRKHSIILMNHSVIQFFGNYHQKMFLKCCKNH